MKKSKKEKMARKEEKQTRALVKEAFHSEKTKGKDNPMVEGLVKSVLVNRAVLKRDKKLNKKWANDYYQELFSKFRKLVEDHNERYQFKANELLNKVNERETKLKNLKDELRRTKEELKQAKKEKGIFENAH
jgi:hypothetical protein